MHTTVPLHRAQPLGRAGPPRWTDGAPATRPSSENRRITVSRHRERAARGGRTDRGRRSERRLAARTWQPWRSPRTRGPRGAPVPSVGPTWRREGRPSALGGACWDPPRGRAGGGLRPLPRAAPGGRRRRRGAGPLAQGRPSTHTSLSSPFAHDVADDDTRRDTAVGGRRAAGARMPTRKRRARPVTGQRGVYAVGAPVAPPLTPQAEPCQGTDRVGTVALPGIQLCAAAAAGPLSVPM